MGAAFAILDLDKDDRFAIFHDQVDFTEPAGEIPVQETQPAGMQKGLGNFFPVAACPAARDGAGPDFPTGVPRS